MHKANTSVIHSHYQGLQLLSQHRLNGSQTTLDALYLNHPSQGQPLLRQGVQDNTWYHTDGLGGVLALSKPDGTLAARYDYDAWGNEIHNTGTSDNPLGLSS